MAESTKKRKGICHVGLSFEVKQIANNFTASAPAIAASTKKPKKTTTTEPTKKTPKVPADEVALKAQKPAQKPATKKTTSKATPAPASRPSKKAAKPSSKPTPEQISAELARFDSASEESEAEAEDDQTAALLAGFSSDSDDDNDAAEDAALAAVDGLQLPVPALPTSAGLDARIATANTPGADGSNNEPGVVYVSRIPHGFYEHQMTAYFSQFGDITRLRLSRNRRTGASKHYAFIEFAHMEVARIVAETMNNYLMFGHSLKVRVVEPERVHAELFKGAGKRFRKVPWNRIERTRLAKTDRKGWEKRVGKEERRRADKSRLLKELGYDFAVPQIRSVESVPVKEKVEIITAVEAEDEAEAPKAIEDKPAVEAMTVEELIGSAAEKAAPEKAKKASVKAKKTKKVKA